MKRSFQWLSVPLLFLIPLSTGCSDGGSSKPGDQSSDGGADSGANLPLLIVDSDLGLDDARVIVSLPLQEVFETILVATVEGAAGAEKGADNALRLLSAMDEDGIPVAAGSTTTLTGEAIPPPAWRATAEGLGGIQLDPSPSGPCEEDGLTAITHSLEGSDEPVHILAIGPVTNIAKAIDKDPYLAQKIATIYLLGDFSTCDCYNCATDPEAGAAILASGIPVYMLLPEITDQMPFDADLLAAVQAIDAPAAELIAAFMANHATGSMKLWDDGLMASMLDKDLISYDESALESVHPSLDAQPQTIEATLLDLWSRSPKGLDR